MPICVCEYCGKPFNNVSVKLCSECSKLIDEVYIKVRRYIYQHPKDADFAKIIEVTEAPEKALNYLIKKGRIEIADRSGGGAKCRACGKETTSGAICTLCMSKLVAEKLTAPTANKQEAAFSETGSGKKRIIPKSYND